jgi:hypothetical protein
MSVSIPLVKRNDCSLLRWYNGVIVDLWDEQLIILIEPNLSTIISSGEEKGNRNIAGQIGVDLQSGRDDAGTSRECENLRGQVRLYCTSNL